MFESQRSCLALTPGRENQSPAISQLFCRLSDRSHGFKPAKYIQNSQSTAGWGLCLKGLSSLIQEMQNQASCT